MRLLLVTGKGGTGKTTVAASTAVRTADLGRKTLIVSTDAAHSLADAFGQRIGAEPTEVTPSLLAQQIDTQAVLDGASSTIQDYLTELLIWAGAEAADAEELAVVPGLDELLALRVLAEHTTGPWDAVVVDCAPTAETVRLLGLPATLRSYLDRVLPVHRRLARTVAPVLRRSRSMPPPPTGVLDAVLTLADELAGLHATLANPAKTSVRLVTTPESMVVAETRRVRSYLGLFDYAVDSVVVNRVVMPDADDPWLIRLRRAQEPHLRTIDACFADLGRAYAPIAPGEVTGVGALRSFAEAIYGDHDPLRWPAGSPVDPLRSQASRWTFTMPLPGVERDDLRLARSGSVMLVTVGPYRRHLPLPDHLRGLTATSAHIRDGHLEVEFCER